MKTQILPNWFKKIGLIIFIGGSIIGGGDDFIRGFNEGYNGKPYNYTNESGLITNYFGEIGVHTFYVLSFIGMLIYMLSKEKIEDDYINLLRLESFQLTTIIGLLVSIIFFSFSKDIKLTLDYYIILFVWGYLITFFIKKRTV